MSLPKIFPIFILLFLFHGEVVFAQGQGQAPGIAGLPQLTDIPLSIKELAPGEIFISAEDKFSIELPKTLSGFADVAPAGDKDLTAAPTYFWRLKDFYAAVTHFTFTGQAYTKEDCVPALNVVKNTYQDNPTQNITAESYVNIGDFCGIELRITRTDGSKFIERTYFKGNESYNFVISYFPHTAEMEQLALKKLDSFKLISPVVFELPQTPVVDRAGSDAKEEGLKGKVKFVAKTSQSIETDDKHRSETKFNERGDMVSESFDNDALIWYGYIEGARVSKAKESKRNGIGLAMTIDGNPKDSKQNLKADPGYQYKYTYKYDNKDRLIEKIWFRNTGALYFRQTYTYSGNKIEILYYHEKKEPYRKITRATDEKGNILTESDTSANQSALYTEYKYLEFDKNGNWTTRAAKLRVKNFDGSVKEYNTLTSRTIEYYP